LHGLETAAVARARLRDIAVEVHGLLADTSVLKTEWAPLGVDVEERAMVSSGGHGVWRGQRLIFVRRGERRERQRYTVAHELCHLLLEGSPWDKWGVEIEPLCDDFAAHVLVPPTKLNSLLGGSMVASPDAVLAVCGEFRVSIAVALRALRQAVHPERVFIFARHRGHRRRPEELAFRVESSLGPDHLFVPLDQRLGSLGIVIDDEALRASAQTALAGAEPRVSFRTRRDTQRYGHYRFSGPATWQARVLGGDPRSLLLAVDVSALTAGSREQGP
jgi:hypothetical protein